MSKQTPQSSGSHCVVSDPSEPLPRNLPGLAPSKWNNTKKTRLIISVACIHKGTDTTAYRDFNLRVVALCISINKA